MECNLIFILQGGCVLTFAHIPISFILSLFITIPGSFRLPLSLLRNFTILYNLPLYYKYSLYTNTIFLFVPSHSPHPVYPSIKKWLYSSACCHKTHIWADIRIPRIQLYTIFFSDTQMMNSTKKLWFKQKDLLLLLHSSSQTCAELESIQGPGMRFCEVSEGGESFYKKFLRNISTLSQMESPVEIEL